ncbi:ArsR/SmtB family transcription factor [Paucibacter soli]|uniref:ArsR/SmtB family transcription factor n=1 Tax=Paucibacter soli TaxID=3133433 RepID=UPI003095D441
MNTGINDELRDRVFDNAAELFAVLAAPCRIRIVCELCRSERNVGELLMVVGGSQPNLSHHLRALFQAGVVSRRRDGAKVYYRLAQQRVEALCEIFQGLGVAERAADVAGAEAQAGLLEPKEWL